MHSPTQSVALPDCAREQLSRGEELEWGTGQVRGCIAKRVRSARAVRNAAVGGAESVQKRELSSPIEAGGRLELVTAARGRRVAVSEKGPGGWAAERPKIARTGKRRAEKGTGGLEWQPQEPVRRRQEPTGCGRATVGRSTQVAQVVATVAVQGAVRLKMAAARRADGHLLDTWRVERRW